MNTNYELLFNLDIPLDYFNKLKNYYYIPENIIDKLKFGNFIYLVDKLISNKKLYYFGILTKIENNIFYFKNKDPIELSIILEKYHLFYRPKVNKIDKAIQMLHIINSD